MDNSNWSKFWRFWFPAILYSGIIFCVSSVPNVKTPFTGIHLDAILHILIYIPFGFLIARAIYNTQVSISGGTLVGMVLLISFLYGSSDEIHQSFVLGRNAEIFDLIADTIGGITGGYAYLLSLKCRRNT